MLVKKPLLLIIGFLIIVTGLFFAAKQVSAATLRDDATGGDCTQIGVWDSLTKTCTLTGDVSEEISMVPYNSSGITLDGAGYAVRGPGNSWRGIFIQGVERITLRNLRVEGWTEGISLESTNRVTIDSVTTSNNRIGIGAYGVSFRRLKTDSLIRNSIIEQNETGIDFRNSGGYTLTDNAFIGNQYHISFTGAIDEDFENFIDTSNTVDGKPIYYLQDIQNQTFDSSTNAGLFFCQNCNGIIVKDLTITHALMGIYLRDTSNSRIEGVNVSQSEIALVLENSSDNVIAGSSLLGNGTGVLLTDYSERNRIEQNQITGTTGSGIVLGRNGNFIIGNTITDSRQGVTAGTIENYVITENTFSNNEIHILISIPSYLPYPLNPNSIYRNNFLSFRGISAEATGFQYFSLPPPIGGNYWQNYDTPQEGCVDNNSDNFCDNTYNPHPLFSVRDYYPWKVRDGWKVSAQKDPVILIPGILGSWQVKGVWYVDPILHTYDDLWTALQNAGYEVGTTLFAFPYQWRQDNVISSLELKNKIEEVKQACSCSKIDLVAHSMGGLVARSYIQGVDYFDDVDQLIFLGTPQRGSPESYLRFEAAEGFGGDKADFILKQIFNLEALKHGYLSLVNYIRDRIVSVEQLLPIDNYLRDDATGALKPYPTDYPRNAFLENLNVSPAVDLLKSRVNWVNIIGDSGGQSTVNYIRVIPDPDPNDNKWMHGFPENFSNEETDRGLEFGPGDSTVPTYSQDAFGPGFDKLTLTSKHRLLPTNSQQDIIEELTGVRPTEAIHATTIQKILFITIKSPADIQVIDPLGNRVGKDFVNGNLLTESPLSFYSGFDTDLEFITIPNPLDGEYRVVLEGTGQGLYTVEASLIDDSGVQTESFAGLTSAGNLQEVNFGYDEEQNLIEEIQPLDSVSPEISIVYNTSTKDFLFTAVDEFDPEPSIACTAVKCISTDHAGNTTILVFEKKRKDSKYEIELTSLTYQNASLVKFRETEFGVKFEQSKGVVKDFDSEFEINDKKIVAIDYDRQKNRSIIKILNLDGTTTKQIFSGIKTLRVQTNKGKLIYQIY